MSNSEKFDFCKKEIRSLLLPYQKGCYLSSFQREYKSLIGTRLPAAQFGFKTDIEFLYSMPDVVRITHAHGDYHLLGIADENTKHIQKMVANQKPAKLKGPPPPPRQYNRPRFSLPPRFAAFTSAPEFKMPQKHKTSEKPKLPPSKTPNSSRGNVELPPAKVQSNNIDLPITKMQKDSIDLSITKVQNNGIDLPPIKIENNNTELPVKLSPKEEVLLLVQNHENKLALDDLLVEYKRMYNKNLCLSQYGLSSIEDCIENIPELEIKRINFVNFIMFSSKGQHNSNNETQNSHEFPSGSEEDKIPIFEEPSAFNSINYCGGNVPDSLRKKLQKVADKFPDGVWASEFPDSFKEVTGDTLDFICLGYRCLSDLIDDVPDIFIRKAVAGSRKNYIIFPAKSEDIDSLLFIECIILNFRKILEGYPEGIKIKNILHVYGINYKDALHIEDLGYHNIEEFLLSIESSVPFVFGFIDGEKSVHLKYSSTIDLYREPAEHKNKTIPFDAIIPEFVKFKPLALPVDFDCEKFIPIYVSAVAHPGRLFIQFQSGENAAHGFEQMSREMETFYNSSQSEFYMMKNIHIKEEASCVAKWPSDNHWYRAQILSISSVNAVKVIYIDYGTTDTIPTHLLRYIKKEFIDLPIQALKCCLSYLKPPKQIEKWYSHSKTRILSLCEDIPLMAKFEKQLDGTYSVLLCDTNGEKDVYINDVLCEEGFAEYDLPPNNENTCASPEPKVERVYPQMTTLQALQAQYFLQAFAAVAPAFAQNVHYLSLLEEFSVYCQVPELKTQSTALQIKPPHGPPGFHSVTSNMKTHANALCNTYQISTAKANVNSADHLVKSSIERDSYIFPKSTQNENLGGEHDNDDEVFDGDDDDEEMFQQFCQKNLSSDIQYVRRVTLGDGYKIHIIAFESMPYASSGDVSQLIWNNKEADFLFRKLENKEMDIPWVSLSEDGNKDLFHQLKRFNVKGVQNTTGFKSSVLLFSLTNVIKILNIFGHPSVTLRTRLKEEIANFNPNDFYWQNCYPDSAELEVEDDTVGVTDDDKIKRLCLYDLLAMKESIICKKKRILNNQSSIQGDEIHKLELLQKKVLQRIQEIEIICEEFD